jgi:hypothetical protein
LGSFEPFRAVPLRHTATPFQSRQTSRRTSH